MLIHVQINLLRAHVNSNKRQTCFLLAVSQREMPEMKVLPKKPTKPNLFRWSIPVCTWALHLVFRFKYCQLLCKGVLGTTRCFVLNMFYYSPVSYVQARFCTCRYESKWWDGIWRLWHCSKVVLSSSPPQSECSKHSKGRSFQALTYVPKCFS